MSTHAFYFRCFNQMTQCPSWHAAGTVPEGLTLPVIDDVRDYVCPTCGYDDNNWDYCGPVGESYAEKIQPGKPLISPPK